MPGRLFLGSLSLRRSPCIRENCAACRSGEQHPNYVLYGRLKRRRVAVYVPEELMPEAQRGLDKISWDIGGTLWTEQALNKAFVCYRFLQDGRYLSARERGVGVAR